MTPLAISIFINTIAFAYCGPYFLLKGPTAQSTITGQDGSKLVSQAIAGSITGKGIIGPTFKATTIVQNSQTTTGGNGAYGQSSHGCGSACGGDSAYLQGDATKDDKTIAAGPAGSSDSNSQSVDATIYGQDGSKIVSHVEPGSISDNAIIGPTFDASMENANTHAAGGGGSSGLTSYNCGGNCGSTSTWNSNPYPGQTTIYGQDGTSQGIPKASTSVENTQGSVHGQFSYNCGGACGVGSGHLSSEGTKYNPAIAAGPTDTSNSHSDIGQSTIHGQGGSKTTSEANSGSILNGRVVGPTFTSSTTVQGAHSAGNDVYGHSSYNCDGGACGIGSTRTNKEGTASGSNPNNHAGHATIYGQERSQTHSGPVLGAGSVIPTAYTPVQGKQNIVGNGAPGQSSYNCGGRACEVGSTNLSHESTKGNPTSIEGTSTLNGNHGSEHAVVYGQGGSKIVSHVYDGSISNEGIVGPTFGAFASAENTPVGSDSGQSRQVDMLISHPYHQHSVIHDQGGSRIVSEASAGSILNKGVIGSTFKAYTTTNNAQLTGGEIAPSNSRYNLSKQYTQNHSTIPQEFVRTSTSNSHLFGSNVLGQQPSTTSSITGSYTTGGVARGGSSTYGSNESPHDNGGNSQASINCDGNTCGSKTGITNHEFADGQGVTIHSHIPGSSVYESSQKLGYSVLHGNSQHPIASGVNALTANHADTQNLNTIIPGNLVYQSSKTVEYNRPSHSNAQHPTSDYNINSNGLSASSIKQAILDHHNANAQGVGYSVLNTSPVYGQGAYDSSSIVSAAHTHPNGQFVGHGYYRTSSYAHPSDVFVEDAGSSGNNKFLSGQTNGYLPPSGGDGANSGVQDGSGNLNYNVGNGQDYIESSSFAPATYRRPDNVGSNTQGTAVSSFEGTVQGSGNPSYDCYVIKFPINTYSSNIPADLSLFLKKLVQSSSIKPDVYYLHKHRHHSDY